LLVAALLGERDIRLAARVRPGVGGGAGRGDRFRPADLPTERSDVLAMVDAFRDVERTKFSPGAARAAGLDLAVLRRVQMALEQLRRATRSDRDASGDYDALLVSILTGYVDRVAKRLGTTRSLAIAGGGKAELAETSVVRDAPLMVAVDAEQRGTSVLVRVASAITPEALVEVAGDRIAEDAAVEWNAAAQRAERVQRVRYDGLAIEETRVKASGPEASALLFEAANAKGATAFGRDDELDGLRQRARFAHSLDASVPELDDDSLSRVLRDCCDGRASFAELREANVPDWIRASLGASAAAIDRLAPARITLPSGRGAKVHYEPGKDPYVASRLQDFFGLRDTPRIGGGRAALVLHLLAPNQRAVQVTSDLAGFWTRHYPAIRKELMRKYPRHAWPEDPLSGER
jgi:ATP-dependent helicase HrpB